MNTINLDESRHGFPMIYGKKRLTDGGYDIRFVSPEPVTAQTEFEMGNGIYGVSGAIQARPAKGEWGDEPAPTHYEIRLHLLATFKYANMADGGKEKVITPVA